MHPPIRMITTLLMREGNKHSVCAGLGCPRLDSDHISDSTSRGHRSRLLIIKCSRVTTRTNNHTSSSHFSVSGFSLCPQEAGLCISGSGVSRRQVREEMCPQLSQAQAQHKTCELTRDTRMTLNLLPRRNLFTITFTVTWEIIIFSPPPVKRL